MTKTVIGEPPGNKFNALKVMDRDKKKPGKPGVRGERKEKSEKKSATQIRGGDFRAYAVAEQLVPP